MKRSVLFLACCAFGQNIGSLRTVAVPRPDNLEKYVRDPDALVVLGKALFWDMQAGSDGRQACATCHFHAGADHRAQNQLDSLAPFVPNQLLRPEDFPFHRLADPADNRSAVVSDTAQRVGSAGLFRRLFMDIVPGSAADDGFDAADDPAFTLAGLNLRRVTPRNTPTVINAVFNVRNFWDGRAGDVFGESDPSPKALTFSDGQPALEDVRISNSSLASQAAVPPTNSTEMSYDGRTWPKFGRKMLSLNPLARQRVAPDDGVLGPLANPAGPGLLPPYTYLALVQSAFQSAYWNSPQLVDASGSPTLGQTGPVRGTNQFTQAEFNFALFWGLAIQAYEATLVSGESRFDRFSEGDTEALTSDERNGMQLFRGRAGCTNCHVGPEFTAASFTSFARRGRTQRGFFRTGVRPIAEDAGLGNGAFKTPTLRNVEFTGPFLHNGGQATLAQVVEFYSRGGDFPDGGNLGPGIRRLNLSADDRQAVEAFMLALSDDRVRFERAPFDHPELCVPAGHSLKPDGSDQRYALSAADRWAAIPAVGSGGNPVPLQTFEELLAGVGPDGSRAHTLAEPCAIF